MKLNSISNQPKVAAAFMMMAISYVSNMFEQEIKCVEIEDGSGRKFNFRLHDKDSATYSIIDVFVEISEDGMIRHGRPETKIKNLTGQWVVVN